MNITDHESIDQKVMKSMLADRSTSLDNIDPENETERQRRLETFLKNSKKYKRLSVKVANYQWEADIGSIADESGQISKAPRASKVSFSASIQVIPDTNQKKVPESLIKVFQLLFRFNDSPHNLNSKK